MTTPSRATRLWPYAPAFLLCSLIGTQLLVLQAVLFDPGFSVEADYYRKALEWDTQQEQARQRLELGWQLLLTTTSQQRSTQIEVQLVDREGVRVKGATLSVEAFANARSHFRLYQEFQAVGDGVYLARLAPTGTGLWELRIRVRAEGVDYVERVRRELTEIEP